jgi:hypothetical protein
VGWLVWPGRRGPADSSGSSVVDEVAPAVQDPRPSLSPRPAPAPPQTAAVEPSREDDRTALEHAHPITPEHERMFAHRRLGFAIDDAADANNAAALRDLLDQYHRDFPGDEAQIEAAYRLILDCLEHPGAEARAASERWLEQNNGSVVKRSILRHCVDQNSAR